MNELVRRAQQGDRQALAELAQMETERIARIVSAHAPRELRSDWTQEVFVALVQRITEYRPTGSFEHWVSRLAINRCRDLHRERSRKKRKGAIASFELDQIASREKDGPSSALERSEWIERLLDLLDPEDRMVLVMLDVEQRSIADIATLMNHAESWVKVRAMRARQELRAKGARFGYGDAL